jgi:DNA-binding response OmpR family regulator
MALILRRSNYQVDTTGSAAEALKNLETSQYDLAILDMMMPDNGSILLPKVLSLYPCLPILVLTAQVSPETRYEAAHKGPHFRLTKPVTPETLLERVRLILEKKPC